MTKLGACDAVMDARGAQHTRGAATEAHTRSRSSHTRALGDNARSDR